MHIWLNAWILKGDLRKLAKVSAEKRYAAFSLYQGMFTPRNLSCAEVIPDDRPYAGLLAVNVHLVKITATGQKVFGMTAGLVGPHSLAEKAQSWLHETFDWTRPMGWKNQLRDEPVLNLWFGRNWLFYHGNNEHDGFQYGAKTGVNAQLGNLLTSAGGFLELGLGWNFRPELEVSCLGPFSGDLSVGRLEKFSIFGFMRAEGRIVARNLLLQGNTFVSSPGVKINHLYSQITVGLGYRNAFSAARFYLVVRSKEFQGQKYHDPYLGLTIDLNL
ncbi:MAG: lipid A deacylase LpxR family protein [Candidatus Aminicenantes bacterium]|nr:lipid A deacylase LpxR family protein [Candidatus Aminicenantes bacterium]